MIILLPTILRSMFRLGRSSVLIGLVSCVPVIPLHAATFVVDRFDDANGSCDPGDCSLREALLAAEVNPGQDTVILPSGLHTLSIPEVTPGDLLHSGDLDVILHDVEIYAPAGAVIDAQGIAGVFRFWGASSSRLINLTITGGSKPFGLGGGIYIEGSNLELENVWIVGNQAWRGGGLAIELGTVTLDHVTISDNDCEHSGGGVYLFGISQTRVGRLELSNSTISGNHSDQSGGAIYIAGAGELQIEYSTIVANTNRPGDPTIRSFLGYPPADALYTLIEGTCSAGSDASCIYLSSKADEVAVADLGLEPLAMNGGSTPTHALLPTSPAIDIVPLGAVCPPDDQRGVARPQDGNGDHEALCDAGSFELIRVPLAVEIPTLDEIALFVLMLLLACAGVVALRPS